MISRYSQISRRRQLGCTRLETDAELLARVGPRAGETAEALAERHGMQRRIVEDLLPARNNQR